MGRDLCSSLFTSLRPRRTQVIHRSPQASPSKGSRGSEARSFNSSASSPLPPNPIPSPRYYDHLTGVCVCLPSQNIKLSQSTAFVGFAKGLEPCLAFTQKAPYTSHLMLMWMLPSLGNQRTDEGGPGAHFPAAAGAQGAATRVGLGLAERCSAVPWVPPTPPVQPDSRGTSPRGARCGQGRGEEGHSGATSRQAVPWGTSRSSTAACGSSAPPGGRAPCAPARRSSRGGWPRCGP